MSKMLSISSKIVTALSVLATLAQAAPTSLAAIQKRSFSCSSLVSGLNDLDCEHMSTIGMYAQGVNSYSNNGLIWIGDDGANTFTFTADAGVDVTLIIWNNPSGDYSSSFMNVEQPQISYSLADQESVVISMANDVSGAWSGLYNRITTLSEYGQVYNTWGEFTTGDDATVDVSREVNMGGNAMTIQLDSGCVSDMDTCVFECISGNTCGDADTYELTNCAAGSQTGASSGEYDGEPSGGCTGFSDGGHMSIAFYN